MAATFFCDTISVAGLLKANIMFDGVWKNCMYRFMDEEEIEIRQMDNLKMIHMYQLGGNDAIAVYYGDNKQLNLCSMDKNYNLLMERVLTLYSACNYKDSIIIEDNAKKLLDKALVRPDNHTAFFDRVGKRYMNLNKAEAPRFASDGVMREALMPMLCYYIKQLYQLWDLKVEIDTEAGGWHRNCVLKLNYGENTAILPVRTDFNESNACIMKVGNFLQDMSTLEFSVTYTQESLKVVFECEEIALVGENNILVGEEGIKSVTNISLAGKTIYYMSDEVPTVAIDAPGVKSEILKSLVDLDTLNSKIYVLPWGGYVIVRLVDNIAEDTKRRDVDTIFIEENNTKVAVRYFSYGLVENIKDGLKLKTDGVVMRRLYYGDKHKEIETLFLPVGYYSGWDYKQHLENKYFYESMEENL